ncbi:predicted protein [Plenodomus lingam JN3]|uniref:Predicted protein n=1 Tax=Leptosphaeria maculans (strain JN3 / isolate v23.1.3 / race Av1-4-5-6-7-8) TaxID=985895 RepID=E4ZZV0_LEPMJ|nr:predicted protein [Plenodomus lingam JN3]CBX96810.1 predicted protein [Plenodomus lingam JN3]
MNLFAACRTEAFSDSVYKRPCRRGNPGAMTHQIVPSFTEYHGQGKGLA